MNDLSAQSAVLLGIGMFCGTGGWGNTSQVPVLLGFNSPASANSNDESDDMTIKQFWWIIAAVYNAALIIKSSADISIFFCVLMSASTIFVAIATSLEPPNKRKE